MDDAELERVGEQTMEKVCNTACHNLEKVFTVRRTGRDWGDVMVNMAGRGVQATDEQFAIVRRYLTRYFGLVPVNSATADELSAVMGFSSRDAQAIVDHRKVHGRFADVDALLKVAGIDKTKIEEQPEALRFDGSEER
jgi:competence ComEA-like helix-hairpin-helix protein